MGREIYRESSMRECVRKEMVRGSRLEGGVGEEEERERERQ